MTIDKGASQRDSLRANLLNSEPIGIDRLHRLQEQIQKLAEHRLTKRMRIWWWCGLVSSSVFAVFGGFIAVTSSIDPPLRIVWWLYTVGNVFVACFAAALLRHGHAEPRKFFWFGIVIATLALGCFASLLCRAAASPSTDAAIGAGFGEFCVLVDLILLLYGRIAWAHLSTKEHLLRLELLILDSKAQV